MTRTVQTMSARELHALAARYQEDVVRFCQRLVQIPSPSGQEGELAQFLQEELTRLGYDRVWRDEVGNVIGYMAGEGGRSILLNTHMDQVDIGDPNRWPYPPYGGEIHDGCIWGRGASDVKGALAAQVYAVAALRQAGVPLPGDVYFTGVVMEETGGAGTRHLVTHLKTDVAILGEATYNHLRHGHRGRVAVRVTVRGRSVHASVPQRGRNPHYPVARFLTQLEELPMAQDPVFGSSTVAPTTYRTDQQSENVIPGEVSVLLDWRNVPGDPPEAILNTVRRLLEGCAGEGYEVDVRPSERALTTYTGVEVIQKGVTPAFNLPADHPVLVAAQQALEDALGRSIEIAPWTFCTDGGYLMEAGIPTFGFAPCEEHLAHTIEDRISIEMMLEGMIGYMALILKLGVREEDQSA